MKDLTLFISPQKSSMFCEEVSLTLKKISVITYCLEYWCCIRIPAERSAVSKSWIK